MKILSALFLLSMTTLAVADDATKPRVTPAVAPPNVTICFQLSADGKAWSKTPELLCVGQGDKAVEIKLTAGIPLVDVAVFHLDLKSRVRCSDCNKDEFALTNPSNSVFNQLAIKFDGKRDVTAGTETGTVSIGRTSFHYRRMK
ncbi:MAG: hypothetical protein JWO36_1729 [Myxococcales bacterium]|nr:hypothetical protein [Myxococcales bacterium]